MDQELEQKLIEIYDFILKNCRTFGCMTNKEIDQYKIRIERININLFKEVNNKLDFLLNNYDKKLIKNSELTFYKKKYRDINLKFLRLCKSFWGPISKYSIGKKRRGNIKETGDETCENSEIMVKFIDKILQLNLVDTEFKDNLGNSSIRYLNKGLKLSSTKAKIDRKYRLMIIELFENKEFDINEEYRLLKIENKQLKDLIEHLKYAPVGYEQAIKDWEVLVNKQKEEIKS